MSENNTEEELEQSGQTFISHLIELRDRLLKIIACVLIIFLGLTFYANQIYSFIAGPLLKHMPANSTMIAIDVASPFLTPFKLALIVAIFASIPVILYQFWAFVAPGLYKHERKLILPLLISSSLLFYAGVAFAYFVVFPLVFGFLTAAAPVGVAVMTDITKYLDFALTMFFAFGICFEVPIFTIVMVWTGLVTPAQLAEQRPYVIVGAFIIGMFLTPPDAVSQTMLAIPMWLLFEIGLFFSRLFTRKSDHENEMLQAIEKKID
ncbi:Sec-independent protein translocase protein TatC [Methyloglobulus morosus KoM1]|uniref:Sec-independent protein translocase protein TatC n=1 Tax=Methyloglobulus morosus KoM1 TaxID=1116472 RepID=V5C4F0_9GAMM|nr:twin-arginine translocase subunit TatC [Methyloglobulus morosus]ESS71633.1 Sec-independent protein translocase protein TatC [Methyloglobulus morosus KoM1]